MLTIGSPASEGFPPSNRRRLTRPRSDHQQMKTIQVRSICLAYNSSVMFYGSTCCTATHSHSRTLGDQYTPVSIQGAGASAYPFASIAGESRNLLPAIPPPPPPSKEALEATNGDQTNFKENGDMALYPWTSWT